MSSSAISLLMRFAFILEPLTPRSISLSLNRKLKEWKENQLIDNYETRTERIGKFHYKIHVNLIMTSEQARNDLLNFLVNIFKRGRR